MTLLVVIKTCDINAARAVPALCTGASDPHNLLAWQNGNSVPFEHLLRPLPSPSELPLNLGRG